MAEIDDALIDNLREALAAHAKHGEIALLLSAAQEIAAELGPVITAAQAREAGRCRDRDGDVWTPDGIEAWAPAGESGVWPLEFVEATWGPLREVCGDDGT